MHITKPEFRAAGPFWHPNLAALKETQQKENLTLSATEKIEQAEGSLSSLEEYQKPPFSMPHQLKALVIKRQRV